MSGEADVSMAVLIYAHFLGIDIETEPHLLYIAEDALSSRGLPAGWEVGVGEGDNEGIPYFYNTKTSESVWNHPREAMFQRKVKEEKAKDKLGRNQQSGKRPQNQNQNQNQKEASQLRQRDQEQRNLAEKALAKPKEVDMEVMEFEDIESEADVTPLKGSKPNEASKNGTATANANSGFGLQAQDFFSSDEAPEDDKKPAARPASATNATASSRPRSPGPGPKPAKPSSTTSWANAGKKADSPPQSPGTLSRISGPPVSSRGGPGTRNREGQRPSTASGSDPARSQNQRGGPSANDTANARDSNRPRTAEERPTTRSDWEKQQQERDMRNRERDREMHEREALARDRAREREMRDREIQRERERERERDRERERERGRDILLRDKEREREVSDLLAQLDAEKRKLQSSLDEAQLLRDKVRRAEDYLEEERNDRRDAEERLHRLQGEADERVRDLTDKWEERVREATRSGKQDLESDWKERLKHHERRNEEEVNTMREELRAAKIRADDALKEIDNMRRKISQSREEGKMESQLEIERLRNELDNAESKAHAHALELRKLREEHVDVGGRLAAALQQVQVAQAEGEAAKSQAAGIIAEGKSSHTALVQATNRIQVLDGECAKLKAENLLHRREIDAQQAELRKLQASQGVSIEKVHASEAESRRMKSETQTEVSRLSSKCSELEAVVDVLRSQLEKAQGQQDSAVNDVERQLDRSIFDNHRLTEQIRELESRCSSSSSRAIDVEKKLVSMQDDVFHAEHSLREEKQRCQNLTDAIEEQRSKYEKELSQMKDSLYKENLSVAELRTRHSREIEEMKAEVAERIPKISQSVAERLEGQFQSRMESEIGVMRVRYDTNMQDLKREMLEMQASHAEKDARQRAIVADDRAELERLRGKSSRQQQQIKDLESEIDDLVHTRRHRYMLPETADATSAPSAEAKHDDSAAQSRHDVSGLATNEDTSAVIAVSQLQGQLAWMKQQLNTVLDSTAEKTAPMPFVSPHSKQSDRAGVQRVSFSPESLFQSPNPMSSKSGTTGMRSALGTQRPDKGTGAKSVFSHIRFKVGDALDPDINGGDDFGETALPYGSVGNQSAIERSYAYYDAGPDGIGGNDGGISATERRERREFFGSDLPQPFDGIQDGGFHEGYWKARYSKQN